MSGTIDDTLLAYITEHLPRCNHEKFPTLLSRTILWPKVKHYGYSRDAKGRVFAAVDGLCLFQRYPDRCTIYAKIPDEEGYFCVTEDDVDEIRDVIDAFCAANIKG